MTNLKTRIELDSSGLAADAREASQAIAQVSRSTREAAASFNQMSPAAQAAIDNARSGFNDLRARIEETRRATEDAGAAAKKTGVSFQTLATIGAVGTLAIRGVSDALRATGQDAPADYVTGIGGGALSGALVGSRFGGLYGAAIGTAVGAAAGGAGTFIKRQAAEKQAAEELQEALQRLSLGSAAALRGIDGLANSAQAEKALASLREELIRLEQAMAMGLESGPAAERMRRNLGVQIDFAESRAAGLRGSERAGTIAESRSALAEYRQERQGLAARQSFSNSLEAAADAAARMDLVNTRLAEFARRGDELRAALADVTVQADETRFAGLLGALREVDSESDRLQSMRFKDPPRLDGGRDVILTDALTRIGGGSGYGAGASAMNAVERHTAAMERTLVSVDRHLADMAAKTNTGAAAWA